MNKPLLIISNQKSTDAVIGSLRSCSSTQSGCSRCTFVDFCGDSLRTASSSSGAVQHWHHTHLSSSDSVRRDAKETIDSPRDNNGGVGTRRGHQQQQISESKQPGALQFFQAPKITPPRPQACFYLRSDNLVRACVWCVCVLCIYSCTFSRGMILKSVLQQES